MFNLTRNEEDHLSLSFPYHSAFSPLLASGCEFLIIAAMSLTLLCIDESVDE